MSKATKPVDETTLKRLGGGRWQSRDARFTVEPQSGTWVVVDAEQTDDLGLPLVRGPFGSLGAAKEAITEARVAEPAVSSLASKVAEHRDRPPAAEPSPPKRRRGSPLRVAVPAPAPPPESPPEPAWIQALPPAGRRRAYELIERLAVAGAPDPEDIARREVVIHEPAIVAFAIQRAIAALGPGAPPGAVTRMLASGEDAELAVSWHVVDGEGRVVELGSEEAEERPK